MGRWLAAVAFLILTGCVDAPSPATQAEVTETPAEPMYQFSMKPRDGLSVALTNQSNLSFSALITFSGNSAYYALGASGCGGSVLGVPVFAVLASGRGCGSGFEFFANWELASADILMDWSPTAGIESALRMWLGIVETDERGFSRRTENGTEARGPPPLRLSEAELRWPIEEIWFIVRNDCSEGPLGNCLVEAEQPFEATLNLTFRKPEHVVWEHVVG